MRSRCRVGMGLLLAGLLAGGPAQAAPTGAVHGWGAVGEPGRADLGGGGLGLALGLPLAERLHLDLAVEGGLGGSPAPWLSARPELRLFLSPRVAPAAALSVVAGGGLRWSETLHPDLSVGAALDLPGQGRLVPRLQGRYLLDPTGEGSTILLGAGFAWPRPRPPAVVEAPAPPPPEESWIWVPHPVRACVLESGLRHAEAGAADVGPPPPSSPVQAAAIPPGLDLAALLNPTQGSLVIAASPGDEVQVGGVILPLGPDGIAVTTAPEGPIRVILRGAGRTRAMEPSVAAGYAVWIRHELDPSPHLVAFGQGSATLSDDALARLRTLVENAGGWRFELQGRYSAEGTAELNRDLAMARAAAVRDALLAAGLPADRIAMAPVPGSVDPEGDPAALRTCLITPLAPGAAAPGRVLP